MNDWPPKLTVGASIGIALSVPGDTVDELLRNADVAMYTAKGAGRGRSALFEPDKTRLAQRIAEAQAAIAARRQELLAAANDAEEKRVLDNAAFSLLALAQCFSMSQVIAHRGVEHRSAV